MRRGCGMDGVGDPRGNPGAEHRVLVVTGAGSGIGRSVARTFLTVPARKAVPPAQLSLRPGVVSVFCRPLLTPCLESSQFRIMKKQFHNINVGGNHEPYRAVDRTSVLL